MVLEYLKTRKQCYYDNTLVSFKQVEEDASGGTQEAVVEATTTHSWWDYFSVFNSY